MNMMQGFEKKNKKTNKQTKKLVYEEPLSFRSFFIPNTYVYIQKRRSVSDVQKKNSSVNKKFCNIWVTRGKIC